MKQLILLNFYDYPAFKCFDPYTVHDNSQSLLVYTENCFY